MTRLRGQAIAVVGIPLLISLAALVGIAKSQDETQFTVRQTAQSNARIFASELLLLRLVELETGVRGYAATRDTRFREPYVNARRELPDLLTALESGGARQPAPLRGFIQPITRAAVREIALLTSIDRTIAAGDLGAVSARLLMGKAGMDRLRSAIAGLQKAERAGNTERRARVAAVEEHVRLAIIADCLFAILASTAAVLLFMNRVVRRLAVVIGHTERVAASVELGPVLEGHDEIRSLDIAVHQMSNAINVRSAELARSSEILDGRNAELRLVNAELETFTYSVSHDLRATVRAVESFSRRLDSGHAASLDPEGRRLLGIIRGEAVRMGLLIDDLLTFSKLARQHVQTARVNMTELAREVIMLSAKLEDAVASFAVAELPHAWGDRTLLRQVWENLIGNAIKYSTACERPAIRVYGAIDGETAVYHVADNGIGFDMKYAEKIFAVFERLHGMNEYPGSGVGLSIVKRIVERHGGVVWSSSTPGDGATFSFSLPAKDRV